MVMKKMILITGLAFFFLPFICSTGWSIDFVSLSDMELFNLRGTIHYASEADQKTYQAEWEKRVSNMTAEEKKQFVVPQKSGQEDSEARQPFLIQGKGYDNQQGEERVIDERIPQLKQFDPQ